MKTREKQSYLSKDRQKRARSLANLTQNRPGLTKIKSPFLRDKRNKDIRYFLSNHYILDTGKPIKLEDWQVKNFLDPVYPPDGSRPYELAILSLPKKNGKSEMSSGCGLFELYFSNAISPEVYSIAKTSDQARIIFQKAVKAVKRNKTLKKVTKIYKSEIITPFNGGSFRCLASDEDSAEGKNPSCILLDEAGVSQWKLFTALQSGMGQRVGTGQKPISIITSTAGYDLQCEYYKICQKALRGDLPGTYIFETHSNLASWIKLSWLTKQRTLLSPQLYQRYHENKWSQGAGAFVTKADIDKCLSPGLSPRIVGEAGNSYVLGLDLGLNRSRTALCIVHRQGNEVILDLVKVWQPRKGQPVIISEIEEDLLTEHKNFPGLRIWADPWQMRSSMQRLGDAGIRIKEFIFNTKNIDSLSSNLYQLIHGGILRIYRDERLIDELLSVNLEQRAFGTRISPGSGGYSDIVIALGMAAMKAVSSPGYSGSSGFRAIMTNERGEPIFGNVSPLEDLLERKKPSIWGMVERDKKREADRRRYPLGNRSWWNEIGRHQR